LEQLAKEVGSSAADVLRGTSDMLLGQRIRAMLQSGGPLLLVLDDLWSKVQVEGLLGSDTRLPHGSQLLLTSRRSDVVASHDATVVPMELLPDASALALLAWHSCGEASVPAHLAEVAVDALRGCGGLPLAVKVLGGALRRELATQQAWKVSHQPRVVSAPWTG
jgi:hypothetical protein